MGTWVDLSLLWCFSGFLGIILIIIKNKVKGKDLSHLYKDFDFGSVKLILLCIFCGPITLSVALTPKKELEKEQMKELRRWMKSQEKEI